MNRFRALLLTWTCLAAVCLGQGLPDAPFHPCSDFKTGHLTQARLRQLLNPDKSAQSWDVLHYRLELEVSLGPNPVVGSVDILFQSKTGGLSEVTVNLYDNMALNLVTMDGVAAGHTRLNHQVRVSLPHPLADGETGTLRIEYSGNPQNTGFDSFTFEYHGSKPIISSLSEPYGAPTWWACKDDPADKATADIILTVPAGLTGVSNGTLVSTATNPDGTSTSHWAESYPISTYLVSVAITNYLHLTDTYVSPLDGRTMPLDFYVYPEHENQARAKTPVTKDMIAVFAQLFCEYPFIDEKYGLAEFPWGGGMEHQTITSMGASIIGSANSMDSINAHELAHQWWGDMITMATWPHIWLNEGFATYSEALWAEARYGTAEYHQEMNSMATLDYFQGSLYITNPTVNNLFDITVYYKGAWVLHMLRGVVGDAAFFEILKAYANSPALRYGNATTEDFQAVCESVSGRSLDWFFREWIYGEENPYYRYTLKSIPLGRGTLATVQLRQDAQGFPFFRMPVEFRLSDNVQTTVVRAENHLPRQQFAFYLQHPATRLTVDPDNWILKQRSNSNLAMIPVQLYPQVEWTDREKCSFGFANLGSTAANVRFTLLDAAGATLAGIPQNPVSVVLAPQAQEAYELGSLFTLPETGVEDCTLRVESDSAYLESYFMRGQADYSSLDGAFPGARPGEAVLLVPGVMANHPAGATRVNVAASGPENAHVQMTVYDREGVLAGSLEVEIPAGASRSMDLAAALAKTGQPLEEGHLRLLSDQSVTVESSTAWPGVAIQNPVLDSDNLSGELWAPHFATGAGAWETSLHLVNLSAEPEEVQVHLLDEAGHTYASTLKANPAVQQLAPGQTWSAAVSTLFGLTGPGLHSGYLHIRGGAGALLCGYLEFGDPDGLSRYRAALPLLAGGTRAMLFPHVALGLGYYTGISLLNPAETESLVRLDLFNKQGGLVGTVEFALASGQKYARLLDELWPSAGGQVGGYLAVTASQPILGYQLFGREDFELVSAIPAHPLD